MKVQTLKSNAIWTLGNSFFNIVLLLVLTPFIINSIGSDQYGIYVLLSTINGVAGVMELGLVGATIYYIAFYNNSNDSEGVNRTFNSTLFIHSLMTLLVFIIINIYRNEICDTLHLYPSGGISGALLVTLSSITLVFFSLFDTFTAIPQAVHRFDIFAKIMMLRALLQFVISIFILWLGYGLLGLVVGNVGLSLFLFITGIVVAKRMLPTLHIVLIPTKRGVKEVLGYGIYNFASRLVGLAWQFGDTLIIGYLLGARSVGFYSVPQQMFLKGFSLLSMSGGIGKVLFPKFASVTDLMQRERLYINATYLFLFITMILFIPLVVFIEEFIKIWISEEFAKISSPIAELLAIAFAIRGAFIPYQALLLGMRKPNIVFYISLLSSSTVLISALVLIPLYGLKGAGYANLLSTFWGIVSIIFISNVILKMENFLLFFGRLLILWSSGSLFYYGLNYMKVLWFHAISSFSELLIVFVISYFVAVLYFTVILFLIGKEDILYYFLDKLHFRRKKI